MFAALTRRSSRLCLILAVLLLLPARHVAAQAGNTVPWEGLQNLGVGTRIQLTLTSGAVIVGSLVSTRGDELVIRDNALLKGPFYPPAGTSLLNPLTFHRADIVSLGVAREKASRASKTIIWSVIIYITAGAIIGYALTSPK